MPEAREANEWDDEGFEEALKKASEGVIEASGRRISSEQLRRLMDAARQGRHDARSQLATVNFNDVIFSGDANFAGAIFSDSARFVGATFSGFADFLGAIFGGGAYFGGATFDGDANFTWATFGGRTDFSGATFSDWAPFRGATFGGEVGFDAATFNDATFTDATFSANATFDESTFNGDADFGQATFGKDAIFRGVTFDRAKEFGPVHVFDRLWLDEVVFAERVRIEASASRASFARAEFRAGADIRLRWAELWLEDSVFAEPSLVTGLEARLTPDGRPAFLGWEWPGDDGTWYRVKGDPPECFAPRVLSARGATVANLTLSGINLKWCRFAGTHGLDELQLERVDLPETPEGWQRTRVDQPETPEGSQRTGGDQPETPEGSQRTRRWPVRWTRRRIIAEEQQWRAWRHDAGWAWREDPEPRPPQPPRVVEQSTPVGEESDAVAKESDAVAEESDAVAKESDAVADESDAVAEESDAVAGESDTPPWPPERPGPLDPEEIAALYRRLRKGCEDSRNAPGANAFYYGERELRRRHTAPLAERVILWLYWLFSGYGLRASRALVALVVTIAVAAIPLALWGFHPDRSYARALLFSLESSISLLRAPQAKLSAGGEVTQIVLRLAGPLFFGLALLALRGRVKR